MGRCGIRECMHSKMLHLLMAPDRVNSSIGPQWIMLKALPIITY